MRNFMILLLMVLFVTFRGLAQLPHDFRSEQIYVSPGKSVYYPGDTLQVEGMVTCLSAQQLQPYSKYLYVELCNNQDSVLMRQKIGCKDKGYFKCNLITDYTWEKGVYYLRAYTKLMCNFSPESFAMRPFLLGEKFPEKEERILDLRCKVIPAGETWVADYPQMLTIHLTDHHNFPVEAKLYLREETGDTVAMVHTSLSGLATVGFIPNSDKRYFLTSKVDGLEYRFSLPKLSNKVKIQGYLNGNCLNYQILNAKQPIEIYQLFFYDRQKGLIKINTAKQDGIINLDHVPQVMTLFLTDSEQRILSEYTVIGKYRSTSVLQAPQTINLGDSLHFNMTNLPNNSRVLTRVVPANDPIIVPAEGVVNYLSDYVSSIPFPTSMYATDDDIMRSKDLLAWISTAKFKRFQLAEVLAKDTAIYTHLPEEVMSFGGCVKMLSKRSFKEGVVLAYHDKTNRVYDTSLDKTGYFNIAVDDFCEGDRFFLQFMTSQNKPEYAEFHLDDEVYPAVVNFCRYQLPKVYYTESVSELNKGDAEQRFWGTKSGMWELLLPDITVKARVRNDVESKRTESFYRTNYIDQEKIEESNFRTLRDILQEMPGVIIGKDWNDKEKAYNTFIISSRGRSTDKINNLPILIDGSRTSQDLDFLFEMPAFEIESVELLRPWQTLAYVTGAIEGALLIKTRNYKERPDLPSKGVIYQPKGLSSSAEYRVSKPWVATEGGLYRLIVDVFEGAGVRSYEHIFKVQ